MVGAGEDYGYPVPFVGDEHLVFLKTMIPSRTAEINYTLDAYRGGHVDRTRERFESHLLPFFSQRFSRASAC